MIATVTAVASSTFSRSASDRKGITTHVTFFRILAVQSAKMVTDRLRCCRCPIRFDLRSPHGTVQERTLLTASHE